MAYYKERILDISTAKYKKEPLNMCHGKVSAFEISFW